MENSYGLVPFHRLTFVAHSWGGSTRQSHCLVRRGLYRTDRVADLRFGMLAAKVRREGYRILMTHRFPQVKCIRMITFGSEQEKSCPDRLAKLEASSSVN